MISDYRMAGAAVNKSTSSAASTMEAVPAGAERILVIEDDRAVQKALKRLFEGGRLRGGYRGNGAEGLEMFRAAAPSVTGAGLEPAGHAGAGRVPRNQPGSAFVADHHSQRANRSDGQSAAAGVGRARLRDQALQSAGTAGAGADGDAALDADSADRDFQVRRRQS
jgi:hypothetical protein